MTLNCVALAIFLSQKCKIGSKEVQKTSVLGMKARFVKVLIFLRAVWYMFYVCQTEIFFDQKWKELCVKRVNTKTLVTLSW
jgi:hypothetical protein